LLIINIIPSWHLAGILPFTGRAIPVNHQKSKIMNQKYQKKGVDEFHPRFITTHKGIMPMIVLFIA